MKNGTLHSGPFFLIINHDIHSIIMFNIHYNRFKNHRVIDFPTFSNDF